MKIDESVIAKVLDNKASPEEARKVAGWFAIRKKVISICRNALTGKSGCCRKRCRKVLTRIPYLK